MMQRNALLIREGGGEFGNWNHSLTYDLEEFEVLFPSNNMRQILMEFKNEGEIYHQFVQSMPDFVKRVPPDTWFQPVMKQLLLPPFGPEIQALMRPTDGVNENQRHNAGDEWEDKFRT